MISELQSRLIVFAILLIVGLPDLALAFQRPDSVPPQPRLLPMEWPVPGRLDYRIRDLEVGRARVGGALSVDSQSQRRPIILDSIQRRLSTSSRQRRLQYAEINKRLDRLEGVLSQRQQIRMTPPTPIPIWSPEPEKPDPPKPAPVPVQSPEAATRVEPNPVKPTPAKQEPIKPAPTIVTESAVDRIALADSLFASSQLETALRLYLELAAEKHEVGEQLWIHFQIGSTSRRLRKYDLSRKHYRIVAGQKSDGLYPKLARWWLDTIQRRFTYEEKQAELQSLIAETEASNAPAN